MDKWKNWHWWSGYGLLGVLGGGVSLLLLSRFTDFFLPVLFPVSYVVGLVFGAWRRNWIWALVGGGLSSILGILAFSNLN